jgi:acyl-CoA synthetase (AMP-forming)/AMP-acid ligase II
VPNDPRLVSVEAVRPSDDTYNGSWLAEIDEGAASDVPVYCYTSGTTGRPKAAMLSHAFVLDNAHRLMEALDIKAGGNYLSYISPAWAAEQFFAVGLPLLAPDPAPDCFIGHVEPALGQEFLHVAVAHGEPKIEPDGVPDDLGRKAMAVVGDGLHGPILPRRSAAPG